MTTIKNFSWKSSSLTTISAAAMALLAVFSIFPRLVQSSSSSGIGSRYTTAKTTRSYFHNRLIINGEHCVPPSSRLFDQSFSSLSSSKRRYQHQRPHARQKHIAFCTAPPPVSTSIKQQQQQQRGQKSRSKKRLTLYIDPWNDDRSIPLMVELQKQNAKAAAAAQALEHDDDDAPSRTMTTPTIQENNNNNKNGDDGLSATTSSAVLLLNVVAVLWGTQHAVIKLIVTDTSNGGGDPASFTLLRFGIASLLASRYTPGLPLLSLSSIFQSPFKQQQDKNNINNTGDHDKDSNDNNQSSSSSSQQPWQLQNGGFDAAAVDLVDSQTNNGAVTTASTTTAAVTTAADNKDSTMTTTTTANDDINYNNDNNAMAWRWGLEMGFWMFLGFCFQAIGLEYTTAQKSGFLLYLNVKFVPFFAYLLFGRQITTATWISAIVAFCGTALLACAGVGSDGTGAAVDAAVNSNALNVGDAWSIAAAAASAMFILRLEKASAAVPNAATLNAACLWTVTGWASLWTLWTTTMTSSTALLSSSSSFLVDDVTNIDNNGLVTKMTSTLQTVWDQVVSIGFGHPWEILYLSAVATALANYIQTKAQAEISPERACIIYAMDPVYGAIFAAWLLGEQLPGGVWGYVGAGMITVAAATNALLDLSPGDDDSPTSKNTSNINDTNATTTTTIS